MPRAHTSQARQSASLACRAVPMAKSLGLQSRKDVEGSLFLVKRRSQPRFQYIILNKKSAGCNMVCCAVRNFTCWRAQFVVC